jgi:putative addiction module component (TIGR02574 family)
MSGMTDPTAAIDGLTPEEQLDLLERLWERLSQAPDSVPVTGEQRSELDRRFQAFDADMAEGRTLGIPWDEVVGRLRNGG